MTLYRDYVGWYKLKSKLQTRSKLATFKEREVWWCSLGANIGDEQDGKHALFERPVIILRKYSSQLFTAVPLSTSVRKGEFYVDISLKDVKSVALLSQIRTLSAKRLQRRIGIVTEIKKGEILDSYFMLLSGERKSGMEIKRSPRFS